MSVHNIEVLGRYTLFTQIYANGFQKPIINVKTPIKDLEYELSVQEPFCTDNISEFIWNYMEKF